MSSLYFADQKIQKKNEQALQQDAPPALFSGEPPMSVASSGIEPMSCVGNDGVRSNSEEEVLEAHVQQMGGSVASDLTEQTGHVSTVPSHQQMAPMPPAIPPPETTPPLESNKEVQPTPNGGSDFEKEKQGGKDHRLLMIVFCICCCLLVAGGVGAGVGIALSKEGDKSTSPQPPQPTAPPVLDAKTGLPTTPPSTNYPTASTIDLAPAPLNDLCRNATALSGITTTFGFTETATTTIPSQSLLGTCGLDALDGPGVWYQVAGRGAVITASTCGDTYFDTKISIFSGTNCLNLECVADNDNGDCGVQSEVSWSAATGVTYYILVRGFDNSQRGDFQLSVVSNQLSNDECSGALPLIPDGSYTRGSTVGATLDYVGICDDVDTTSPGVWYKIDGTGETLIFATCQQTSFDTKISVFSGAGCGGLVCLAANDDACDVQSRVSIDSEVGKTYYVLVHGFLKEVGEFSLSVSTSDNLYNDFCSDARSVPIGTYISGDNLLAGLDFVGGTYCDETIYISGPTVWYSVAGTGGDLTASLCSPETSFDSLISIFTGSCNWLTCVGGNDDSSDTACGFTSEFTWKSKPFEKYLIAVHGYENATGTFEFVVEDSGGAPTFDTCETAGGSVPLEETTTITSTSNSVVDSGILTCAPPSGLTETFPGVWLFATGDGGKISASVCNSGSAKIYVYKGDCSNLICIQAVGGLCSVTWESEVDQIYYMFVMGLTAGDIELTTTTTGAPPPDNDICDKAFPLVFDTGETDPGSTNGASWDGIATCGEEITSPGVWYTITGTGVEGAVGLCTGTEFDTKISVFEGSCDNLSCIGGNDDFCGLQSAFSWFGETGVTYYILVHGYGEETGNFGILALTV